MAEKPLSGSPRRRIITNLYLSPVGPFFFCLAFFLYLCAVYDPATVVQPCVWAEERLASVNYMDGTYHRNIGSTRYSGPGSNFNPLVMEVRWLFNTSGIDEAACIYSRCNGEFQLIVEDFEPYGDFIITHHLFFHTAPKRADYACHQVAPGRWRWGYSPTARLFHIMGWTTLGLGIFCAISYLLL